MIVEVLSSEVWKELAKEAHLCCFGELRPSTMDRISFALLTSEDEKPLGYLTARELDSESVYLQYGGAFPDTRGTINSLKVYKSMLLKLKEIGFIRATTYIENINKPMLKFAMKCGWTITGLRTFKNAILLEHQIEFDGMEI